MSDDSKEVEDTKKKVRKKEKDGGKGNSPEDSGPSPAANNSSQENQPSSQLTQPSSNQNTQIDPEKIPIDATKIFLSSNDPRIKLADLNPLTMKKEINKLDKPVQNIQYLRNGNLFINCSDNNQLKKLLEVKTLKINDRTIPVNFSIAKSELFIQGKIYAPNLKEASLEEILDELEDQKAILVEKLLKDPAKAHVPLYLITFSGSKLPEKVEIAFHPYNVDLYIPSVFKCWNCCEFGHTKGPCKAKTPACAQCGLKGHNISNCDSENIKCYHCSGEHKAFSSDCQKTIDEKNIHEIKFKNQIGYLEARKIYFGESTETEEQSSQSQNTFTNANYTTQFPNLLSSQQQNNPTQNSVWNSPNNIRNRDNLQSNSRRPASNQEHPTHSQISDPAPTSNRFSNEEFSELLSEVRKTTLEAFNNTITSLLPIIIKVAFSENQNSKVECLKELGSSLNMESIVNTALSNIIPPLTNVS